MSNPIILASSSPYRRQLLEKLGINFTWTAPDIDEAPRASETPSELVLRLAQAKAYKVAATHPAAIIIASDQIALLDNEMIGKPHTHDKARHQLKRFSGREITFLTSLCLYNGAADKTQLATDISKVTLRDLSERQIQIYLERERPYDCAGSFKAEGLGICLFEKIESNDPNSLIGLPLIKLVKMLMNEGIDILADMQ